MYAYLKERPKLFTEEGQVLFLRIRDHTHELLKLAGACSMGRAIEKNCGDSWVRLACVDRLVELGEIREVTEPGAVPGQDRIFVAKYA